VIPAIVLCAGLGTRIRPLTDACAKPLVPIGDRPILAHVVDRIRGAAAGARGVIVVNAHHRADDIRAFARGAGLVVSEERDLLGTAGGVAHAAGALGAGEVLVWNGDILVDVDLAQLVAAHAGSGALATLAVVPAARGEGTVGIDDAGRIVRLRRETCAPGESRGGEFVGVHVIGAELRAGLPTTGCLVGDVYLPALRRGARLAAFDGPAAFEDIGSPARYLAANIAWLGARDAWIGAGASIDPAVRLVRSVVGAGARVVGSGALERCVVWSGAVARAPLVGAIVAPAGTVMA
jgi:mannose-1-phosphate guanylyltransferase